MNEMIETPGQALNLVKKALRVEGYDIDQTESVKDGDTEYFMVTGEVVRQEDLMGIGRFTASVTEAGTYRIHSGTFGLIDSEAEEVDPFYML